MGLAYFEKYSIIEAEIWGIFHKYCQPHRAILWMWIMIWSLGCMVLIYLFIFISHLVSDASRGWSSLSFVVKLWFVVSLPPLVTRCQIFNDKEWNEKVCDMWAARAMFGRWSPCGKVVAPIPNNLVDLGIIYQVIRIQVLCVDCFVGWGFESGFGSMHFKIHESYEFLTCVFWKLEYSKTHRGGMFVLPILVTLHLCKR